MKKCPTCDKSFEDSMRFCQIDGTSLIDDAPAFDPYATIVGRVVPPSESVPAVNDPGRGAHDNPTVGSIPISEPDDVLDLPSNDPLKTMYVSDSEMREALGKADQPDIIELPAIESEPPPPSFIADDSQAATRPSFSLNEDRSGDTSGSAADTSTPYDPPRFNLEESKPDAPAVPAPPPSPFGGAFDSNPKSSPFAEREVNSAEAPISAPRSFDEPEAVRFDEAATMMQSGYDQSRGQAQSSPAAWAPPAAPQREWQNQPVGAETPFQPPVAGTDGENKSLAVASLVLGLLSFFCLGLLGSIPAIVLGVMQKSKIKANPAEYGGAGFATAGIVLGAINIVLTVVLLILYAGLIMANL